MEIALLGGSNSVMVYGLSSGLSYHSQVRCSNLALGASSSLQNLNAAIEHRDIVECAGLVVTESNINDSYNAYNLGAGLAPIIDNINLYYRLLSQLNSRVLVLIMPLNRSFTSCEPDSIIETINRVHLDNVACYGFDYINIAAFFQDIDANKLGFMMSDSRHPKPLFMHDLGISIASFYLDLKEKNNKAGSDKSISVQFSTPSDNSNPKSFDNLLLVLKASDLPVDRVFHRNNSKFSATLLRVVRRVRIPTEYIGFRLAGISTWGAGRIRVFNEYSEVVKEFNSLKSFNEIIEPLIITENTFIEPCDRPITEKSVNVKPNAEADTACGFESVLLIQDDILSYGNYHQPMLEYQKSQEGVGKLQPDEIFDRKALLPNVGIYLYDSMNMVKSYGDVCYELSRYLLKDGKLEEAEKFQRMAVQAARKNVRFHMYLSRLLKRRGKLDEAIASAKTAIALGGTSNKFKDYVEKLTKTDGSA